MEEVLVLKNMEISEQLDHVDKKMAQAEQEYGHKVLRKRIMLGYLSDSTKPVPGQNNVSVLIKFHDLVMDKTHKLNVKKELLEAGLKTHGKNKIVGVIISDVIDETGKRLKNGVWLIFELLGDIDAHIKFIKEEVKKALEDELKEDELKKKHMFCNICGCQIKGKKLETGNEWFLELVEGELMPTDFITIDKKKVFKRFIACGICIDKYMEIIKSKDFYIDDEQLPFHLEVKKEHLSHVKELVSEHEVQIKAEMDKNSK